MVACKDAGDKTIQRIKIVYSVCVSIDQTSLILNVIGKLVSLFDTDNGASALVSRFVNHFDKCLGFSGSFYTDDKFQHIVSSWRIIITMGFAMVTLYNTSKSNSREN